MQNNVISYILRKKLKKIKLNFDRFTNWFDQSTRFDQINFLFFKKNLIGVKSRFMIVKLTCWDRSGEFKKS
jgi:hypothetical protein